MKIGICIGCGGKVASRGNRHRKGGCRLLPHGSNGQSLTSRHRSAVTTATLYGSRGCAVAGTGKPSASSGKKAGVKKKVTASSK